ncbi:hypothetical protein ASPZODRAFT_62768 [Penicilliopsis zonata CBS 506.65]|uniref:MI domain-containing protein n=1 Tax=Penicilliopsis zonata CBS 506.65 TaxID=1073090 RepID=A0A1L9SNS1_9EURO|nr:hypothetical protein ASPZODRAFT_62768 [Penicilliopsis zonata CBS 506.65]OJJ48704.1 hypothetical protein ASPZODRAFT_62768 [Penicilliopsis zonata CBS 506.65]
MRHSRPLHNTTSLPRGLRDELGIKDRYGEKKRRLNGPASRKDRRKAERAGKKSNKTHGFRQTRREQFADDGDDDEGGDLGASDLASEDDEQEEEEMPKPILKKSTSKTAVVSSRDDDDEPAESTRRVSKAIKDKLDQDDAEIAALEKKLGLKKGKKLPKSFMDDGLDDLLGDLDEGSGDESRKRKREADEWLLNKRRKAQGLQSDNDSEDDDSDLEDDDLDGLLDEDDEDLDDEDDEDDSGASDEDDEGDFEGFEDEEEEKRSQPKKKENPYVAPVTKTDDTRPNKYIPPSLRAAPTSETESLTRLRRQAQGHLNKLSEANLVSILAEFEKLYREYPRQHVTSTLMNLLFGLVCERSALNDTFVILHAGFIAALYKVIGMDFGAELVQKIVETFDAGGDERGQFEGKELINLISLLSQLYNFHVVGSALVFDYIRIFLQDITESNTELLLKIIRNSGPQLRQDDPSALKDIVLLIQPAVAKVGETSLSVRTKFMIETITDLKNNRIKAGVGSSVTSEHITKMRKILGSLNSSRVIRASEPIRISRLDIHNSSKKGKWWLVGASWKEDPLEAARQELSGLPLGTHPDYPQQDADDDEDAEPDLLGIAKAHRMNTDVRRSIFVAIMSATDYQDAHVRLLKLRLKRAQEFEIPRVLLHCAMEEEAHNPYYTLIARRLCGEMGRRIKVSFMFALWNIFKRMGERSDMDDGDEDPGFDDDNESDKVTMKAIVNLAKMYGGLVADGSLALNILKNLNFAYLQPKSKTFVELMMISVIQQSQKQKKKKNAKKAAKLNADDESTGRDEKALEDIFFRTRDTPQVVKGLIYFLRKVVAKTDILDSDKDRRLIKWGCKVAVDTLTVVAGEGRD